MDRITGPYQGYFIAAYAVANGDGFCGYAKICCERPADPWAVSGVRKLASLSSYPTEEQALRAAEFKACELIDRQAPNSALGAIPRSLP